MKIVHRPVLTLAQEELVLPIVWRTAPLFWTREEQVIDGLTYPQMRIFWAVQLGLIERRKRWFGRGWKLRWRPQ